MIFSIFKTKGHSMEPAIKNGSIFIGSNIPYKINNPKVGDMIIFNDNNKNIVFFCRLFP